MIFLQNHGEGGSELVRLGSSAPNEPLNFIERFLPMCRFENKEKLDDLGLEIDTEALKSSC
jgi:hypothetical protein